jgi:paraquat-inducible protein B
MRKRANPRTVGIFVLGAVALAIAAVAVLGSGRLFHKTYQFVLVFRGNVNGLRIGAPVKIKGVDIGSVTKILLRLNFGLESVGVSPQSIEIPVVIEIDESRIVSRGANAANLNIPEDVRIAVRHGLRAELGMESFVTGLLYIDLDMHPGTPANFALPPSSKYEEIPTLPTTFEQAESAATRLIAQIDKINLDQVVTTANQMMAAFRDLASSPELKTAVISLNQTGTSLTDTARSIRELTDHIDREVGPMAASMQKGAHDIDIAVEKAQVALNHIQATLEPNSPLVYRATQALDNLSAAAQSLRELADYLQRNPSAILRGRYYGKGE